MYRSCYIKDAKMHVGNSIRIAGWVHDFRNLGKLKFVLVRDRSGIIQVIMKKGYVADKLLAAVELNREDVVAFEGTVIESKIAPNGIELVPNRFELLNKVEKKLPVDPADIVPTELDVRIDNRYIDLRRSTPSSIFAIKSIVANAFREKALSMDFVEIHPSLITCAATEGGANVFSLQYFENHAYLIQSPQLYKQLAVIGGFDRVFMTIPVFRAEKHNTTTHLNEIIQMDTEMGFADHKDVMKTLEEMVLYILKEVKNRASLELKILDIDLQVPDKISYYTYTELVERLNKEGFEMSWGEDFSKDVEKKLFELLGEELYFIYNWPVNTRAFYSMPDEEDPRICHAFDLIYRGLEIASGAQRIHKAEMLVEQLKKHGLDPYNFEFYLNAFKLGAPPHAGWSIGLERFVMKICNQQNIREAMLFPRDRTRLHP